MGHPILHHPHAEAAHHERPEPKKGAWTEKIFDMVITTTLVALFFGLPIFFTGHTMQGIAFEKQVYFYFWVLLGLVAWASKGVITGELRIRRTPLDIPILLFVTFYGIDIAFSVDKWHSFFGFFGDPSRGLLAVVGLALAYFLLLSHFTWKRFLWMFGGFTVSGMFVVLWSLLAFEGVHFLPSAWNAYAPTSLIGTTSTLATFLGLLIPVFLTAMFGLSKLESKRRVLPKVGVWTVGLFLLLDLFLILGFWAFVPWPVLFGGMGFFILFILAQVVRPGDQWTWAPMLVFVLVLVFFMIGQNKLLRANIPVEVAPNTALSWDIARGSLKDHFLFGAGPASYGYAFSQYRPIEYNQGMLYSLRFYEGKGLFFEALASIGAIGTLLLAVLWFSYISLGVYLLAFEKHRNKLYSLGMWTMSMMFLIAGFMSSMNGTLVLLGALLSSLALGVLFHESETEEQYWNFSLKASPKFALTLAFIFMVVSAGVAFLFVFVGKVFVADLSAGHASRLTEATTDGRTLLSDAAQLYPYEGRYLTSIAQMDLALANMEAAKPEKERNVDNIRVLVQDAAAAAVGGSTVMPTDALAAESAGQIFEGASLLANDALPQAFVYYEKANKLEPNNPLLLLKMGQVKKAMADKKPDGEERTALLNESKGSIVASIAKKKDLPMAHYFLSLVSAGLKDFDTSVSEMKEAVRLDPKNLNYSYNLGAVYQIRNKGDDYTQAETIFKGILAQNEKLIDVRLSLGLLYERKGDTTTAVQMYEKTLEYLNDDTAADLRDQVGKMISNVKSGKGNLSQPTSSTPPAPAAAAAPTEMPIMAPAPTQTPTIAPKGMPTLPLAPPAGQ